MMDQYNRGLVIIIVVLIILLLNLWLYYLRSPCRRFNNHGRQQIRPHIRDLINSNYHSC